MITVITSISEVQALKNEDFSVSSEFHRCKLPKMQIEM